MRLTGFTAIEYAEKASLPLNKAANEYDEARSGLTIAEAEAIASDDPDLIWLDIPDEDYYELQENVEPDR